jgi:hypothetical protein
MTKINDALSRLKGALLVITRLHWQTDDLVAAIDALIAARFEEITHRATPPLSTDPGTEPPAPWRNHEWHALNSEQASSPTAAQWSGRNWYCIGETRPVSPREMYARGWRWMYVLFA